MRSPGFFVCLRGGFTGAISQESLGAAILHGEISANMHRYAMNAGLLASSTWDHHTCNWQGSQGESQSVFRLIFFGKIILQQFAYNLRNCYRHVKTKSEGFLILLCRYLVHKTSFHDNFGQIMSLLTTAISYQGQTDKKDCAIFLLRGNRDEQRAFYVLIQRWNTDMKKLETS